MTTPTIDDRTSLHWWAHRTGQLEGTVEIMLAYLDLGQAIPEHTRTAARNLLTEVPGPFAGTTRERSNTA
jgi:hypothetical protein